MQRIGRIGLDMDVVAQRAVRAVEELDDAEAFIDRVEQRPVTLLTLGERRFGAGAATGVGGEQRLQSGILAFQLLNPLLERGDLEGRHVATASPECG